MSDHKAKSTRIFAPIFGSQWEELPNVFKRRYGHCSFSDDKIVVRGVLDIECRGVFNVMRPFYRILGSVPAVSERDVDVQVTFTSSQTSEMFHFDRIFDFKQRRPYAFSSRFICLDNLDVMEVMRFGITWRSRFSYENNTVKMYHKGYALHLFGRYVPLPITWLMGAGYGEEIMVDDETFDMLVKITHPLFGEVYSYTGQFKIIEES